MPRGMALAALIAMVALTMLGTAARASAQRVPVDVTAVVSTSGALLGERFRLVVTVTHSTDLLVSVEPPQRSATLQLVEVIPPARSPAAGAAPTATQTTTRFEYVLAAFALGDVPLPAQRVSWLNAAGETGSTQVAAPPITIRGESGPGDTTLRPLKPQMAVAGAPRWWQRYGPYGLGTVVALALITFAAYRWVNRPRRVAIAVVPPTPAVSEARARLDALAAADPLARADYDTYYGTIAEVVRDHLEERFGFNARALTTTELQQRMVAQGVERWQARLVSGLLDRCDAAVYAHRRPDPASADHDLTVAYEIIELSRVEAPAVAV